MELFFSAGDPSGDHHTARVIEVLRSLDPTVRCYGFGGPEMEAAGCDLWYPLVQKPVIGFAEAIRQVPFFWGLYRELKGAFRRRRPDLVVLVDYPGFNWWVARAARAAGVPVAYFLAPQIWAWASWRVRKMRRLVDHVLCAYPFEASWYRDRGVQAVYLGHPYFDELRRVRPLDPPPVGCRRIVLLPGSRPSEIRRMAPTTVEVARRLHQELSNTEFVFACRTAEHAQHVEQLLRGTKLPARVVTGRTSEAIASADCCVAKSGSVTMELMWFEKPAVIFYRVDRHEYAIYRIAQWVRLARVPYISLPNIAANRQILPEFVCHRDPAGQLAEQVIRWLTDEAAYERVVAELRGVKQQFDRPGATEATARYLLSCAAGGIRAAA